MYSLLSRDEITKTYAFIFKNWIMTKRNIFTLFEVLFWPTVGFFSVGLLANFLNLDLKMKAFILVGVVSMSAIQVCQLDVAYVLLYDIWSKALKHGFLAPVGIRHLFIGSWIMGIIRGGIVFFILMEASLLFFHFDFLSPGLGPIALFLMGIFLSSATVGILVCILVLQFGHRAEVAAWSIVSLMLLFCGIYYPVSIMPDWIIAIVQLIPVTFLLEYFRSFYGFEPTFSHGLFKGYALLMIYLFMELILFKWAIRRAKRTGILLKLSE